MKQNLKSYLMCGLVAISCSVFILSACTKESTLPSTPEGTTETVDVSVELNEAYNALINHDIDTAYAKYASAYQKSPTNPTAAFGYALTQLVEIAADPELQDFIEDLGYDALPLTPNGYFNESNTEAALDALDDYDVMNLFNFNISDVQDTVLLEELLPRVDKAITALNTVKNNAGFTYVFTSVEDDIDVEFDMGEVYACLSALYATKAAINIATVWNLDCDYAQFTNAERLYNDDDLVTNLNVYNPFNDDNYPNFGTLRNSGNWATAKLSLVESLNNTVNMIDFVRNEIDDQDNDAIVFADADAISTALNCKAFAKQVIQSLEGTAVIPTYDGEAIWDIAPTQTVALGKFFDANYSLLDLLPVQDENGPIYYQDMACTIPITDPLTYIGTAYIKFDDPTLNGTFPGATMSDWYDGTLTEITPFNMPLNYLPSDSWLYLVAVDKAPSFAYCYYYGFHEGFTGSNPYSSYYYYEFAYSSSESITNVLTAYVDDDYTPIDDIEVRWSIDGAPVSGWTAEKTINYVFPSYGSYTVMLEARDSKGVVSSTSDWIYVNNI